MKHAMIIQSGRNTSFCLRVPGSATVTVQACGPQIEPGTSIGIVTETATLSALIWELRELARNLEACRGGIQLSCAPQPAEQAPESPESRP